MKAIWLLFSLLFLIGKINAQQERFIGSWEGTLDVGTPLRVVFHFSMDDKGMFVATMDSPDQMAYGLKSDYAVSHNDSVYTGILKFNMAFSGKLVNDSTIDGQFFQGRPFKLVVKKSKTVKKELDRPQTPRPPFPYLVKEVEYFNKDHTLKISGTLSYPDPASPSNIPERYPAVLMITGSGPQNRDEEVLGHKPFAVLADFLTRLGFAVLRVDDRGVGQSTGDFSKATTMDFASDAEAGINFLKSCVMVDSTRIGLLGHSEGGLIAELIGARRSDIHFLLLLAAPGIKTMELMAEQNIAMLNAQGISKKTQEEYGDLYKRLVQAVIYSDNSSAAKKNAEDIFSNWVLNSNEEILVELNLSDSKSQHDFIVEFVNQLNSTWMKNFLLIDPRPSLEKIKCKVLALNGSKDIQVLPVSNLDGIRSALKKSPSPHFDAIEIKGLNHLFQECQKCTLAEYVSLTQSFSPIALEIMKNWLQKHIIQGK